MRIPVMLADYPDWMFGSRFIVAANLQSDTSGSVESLRSTSAIKRRKFRDKQRREAQVAESS